MTFTQYTRFQKLGRLEMAEANDMNETAITLTADIVSAHVSNNSVAVNDLPQLIANVHSALIGLGTPVQEEPVKQEPVGATARSSVKPDFIVCLEDGKKLKMLKRHLMTHYQMTPDEYRRKWGLNADYPMVAPNYAEQRRSLAKKIGLGTKRRKSTGSAPSTSGGARAGANVGGTRSGGRSGGGTSGNRSGGGRGGRSGAKAGAAPAGA